MKTLKKSAEQIAGKKVSSKYYPVTYNNNDNIYWDNRVTEGQLIKNKKGRTTI